MFKWLKKVFGLEKSGREYSSSDSTVCTHSGREEVVKWVDQQIQDLQENAQKIDNGDSFSWVPLSTPSTVPPSPPHIRFSLSKPSSPSPQTSPSPPVTRNSPLKQPSLPSPPPRVTRNSPLKQPSLPSPLPRVTQNSPLKQPSLPSPSPRVTQNSPLKQPSLPSPLPRVTQNSPLKQPSLPSPPPRVTRNSLLEQSPLPSPSQPLLPKSPPKPRPSSRPPTPPLLDYSSNSTHTDGNASLPVGQSLKLPYISPKLSSQKEVPSPPSNTQTRLLSGTQAATRASNAQSLLEVSQDKKSSLSEVGISKVTPKHDILPAFEVKVGQTDMKVAGSKAVVSKIQQKSYPSCLLPTTLTNTIGELVTVNGTRYVRVKSKEEVMLVSLNAGPKGDAPCRVVWESGRPVPIFELSDLTLVNIDAFLSPKNERMQAMVVWQKEKPNTCLQLLDNTYIFLGGRSLTCQRKSLNVSAKNLNVTYDGKKVSAEVSNVVAFKENEVITMTEFLKLCHDEFYASVFRMLEGTGSGRVVYVCTCLWIGRRPVFEKLPIKLTRENVYKKISYGLYSPSGNTRTLYCDVNASLNLAKGAATIEVEVDGSCKSLEATHLLNMKSEKLKQHTPVQVRAHVLKEMCGGRENWSAVMIHLSEPTGSDVSSTWVAAEHTAPNINEDGAIQNTSVWSPRKGNTLNREGASISPTQRANISGAPKTSVPTGQKASVQYVPKPTVPMGKTQPKSASLSNLSLSTTAQENNAWSLELRSKYLTCSVAASKPNAAVAVGEGKAILVSRSILFVDQVKCPSSANLQSLLKNYQNLGVIFTESKETLTDMNFTMKYVALVAWAGKKPINANDIVRNRLSEMKLASVSALNAVMKVEASCCIKSVQNNRVTVLVCSKYLDNGQGIALTKLGNIYLDATPITLTAAMKLKKLFWNCELHIADGGKQLSVPLAWRGRKPATGAMLGTSTSQPRQAQSTDDLSDTLNGHRITPPLPCCKVVAGVVTEVLAEGGRVKAEDGRRFTFSIDACFLYDLCLHQMKAREMLVVGMKVEIEVTYSGGSEVVRRVWLADRGASPTSSHFPEPKLDSWCRMNGVSTDTRQLLMKEAELLSPSLFPTAARGEATTIVDISA
ncbi:uncharacterized protein LOC123506368 isoform X2 [Portunus trituberculatus]|uniref:uncharacterized protein LOC123506368 isoform X2 n=1 Tax=Portunus trituberculatus TaxID=210409 RepID=UPI001E1CB9EA|nr:uncharacterized protein LOC123506368 isoform X2 [Portunus trituberculatus]